MTAPATEPCLMLRFRLPPALALGTPPGRWQPCIHKARVDVGEEFDVEIRVYREGLETAARRIAFDQAQRFLVAIAGGRTRLPALTFGAELFVPVSRYRDETIERYAIITGAAVSITRAHPAAVAAVA